jgi:hypothetical protein
MNIVATLMKFLPPFIWDFLAKGGAKKARKMI